MRINNNMLAMNTHRQMGITGGNQSKAMEKLSSGLKINRAGDDAAGLSISEKMRGQIRGLNMASKNAQDGISMIQTAEGALNETHAILQRMRELAVQSSSDTNVNELDRESMQKEFTQLKDEIDRIGNTTEFNTQKLIDGSVGAQKTAGTNNAAVIGTAVGKETSAALTGEVAYAEGANALDTLTGGKSTLYVDGAKIDFTLSADRIVDYKAAAGDEDKVATLIQEDINSAIEQYNKNNGTSISNVEVSVATNKMVITSGTTGSTSTIGVTAAGAATDLFHLTGIAENAGTTPATAVGKEGVYTAGGAGAVKAMQSLTGDDAKTTFTVDGKEISIDFVGTLTKATTDLADVVAGGDMSAVATTLQTDLNAAIAAYNKTVPASEQVKDVTVSVKDGSFVIESGSEEATSSISFDNSEAAQLLGLANQNSSVQGGGVDFQIGANQGQTMKVTIEDMRADALGIADVDLGTGATAREAITTINDAINKVSNQRSELGAFQNRLEHTIKNLDNSAENLQAAESRVRDVDMAKEMMNLTKQNILQQASQAMMAQANSAPQGVLQLLR